VHPQLRLDQNYTCARRPKFRIAGATDHNSGFIHCNANTFNIELAEAKKLPSLHSGRGFLPKVSSRGGINSRTANIFLEDEASDPDDGRTSNSLPNRTAPIPASNQA
jgi:hypothetical protein